MDFVHYEIKTVDQYKEGKSVGVELRTAQYGNRYKMLVLFTPYSFEGSPAPPDLFPTSLQALYSAAYRSWSCTVIRAGFPRSSTLPSKWSFISSDLYLCCVGSHLLTLEEWRVQLDL
jgi:hypothetical protein